MLATGLERAFESCEGLPGDALTTALKKWQRLMARSDIHKESFFSPHLKLTKDVNKFHQISLVPATVMN